MFTLFIGAALSAALAGAEKVESPALQPVFGLEMARAVANAAAARARHDGSGGAIAIVDAGGEPLYLERLDGTFAAAGQISLGKARTAARFGKPTRAFEELINAGRTAMTTLPEFTPLIGGVPLLRNGVVVGAIGVSGGKSADHDEQLALAGASAFEAAGATQDMTAPSGPRTVAFLSARSVAQAFERGQPLLEVGEFKVHASRREAPGEVEVHATETDIVYVLSGAATLVTGGTLVEPRVVALHETRARRVEGGTERRLVPGDFVVVPRGTPHWFREVSAPLTYYVVKVIAGEEAER